MEKYNWLNFNFVLSNIVFDNQLNIDAWLSKIPEQYCEIVISRTIQVVNDNINEAITEKFKYNFTYKLIELIRKDLEHYD